ncbi:MAG TPA: alcohol dehydrogenase catalytic domain-containing protein [Streptosporangiaceae bacterium]|jgi:2-desacetyl-2-hydroxyethyl bacteriochlorophyllide A dehydrogenase|nr:alcohol dehydrogenase catalytic domain-containing protein [Streptosporangiaceae bacterium]
MADRRALVIAAPGSIALQDVPELVPGPGEVVARPVHTGVCGTDLELLAGVVDPAYVRYPLIPGHEWSGVIEAVGPGVTGLQPGQRVIAEGIVPDRVCAECVAGHTNLCLVYDELGFTRAGAAADQVLVPAQVVHVLGDQVSLLDAALAEPAAVAWRAIGRGRPRPGERVAVVGDGTLALAAAHLLRLYSPAELVVAGQRPAQSGLAAQLGATSFLVDTPDAGFDLVIEAAGTAGAVERALGLARRGGRVVLVGLAGNDVTARFPVDDVVNNDLLISASFAYTSAAWAEVTALLGSGQIRLSPLITHRFPLDAYEQAYQVLRESTGPRGKVMLDVSTP